MEVLSEQMVAMGLSIPPALGWRDGEWCEEADWRACGDGGWDVDCCGASGGGWSEYVSDFLFEPAAVEGGNGEAR
jgi:hypothetical protein